MKSRHYFVLIAVLVMVVVGGAWGAETGDANAATDRDFWCGYSRA